MQGIIRTYEQTIENGLRSTLARTASSATDDEAALAAIKQTSLDLQRSKREIERQAEEVDAAIARWVDRTPALALVGGSLLLTQVGFFSQRGRQGRRTEEDDQHGAHEPGNVADCQPAQRAGSHV